MSARASGESDRSFALIAQGGYGRGELNPHSDIDLLFLYPRKITPFVASGHRKAAAHAVGRRHRSRPRHPQHRRLHSSGRERHAGAHVACWTRAFCAATSRFFRNSKRKWRPRLLKTGICRFIREKLEENRARHAQYGGSVYLLEPEVKEGEGGLRDIQTARWIARAKLKAKDLDALALNGIVGAGDIAKLKESQDFFLRVRNELHFSTGKHQDQLTFEQQEKVSAALGFEGEEVCARVEVFMRAYYLHAAQISRLSHLIIHRVTECDKPRFRRSVCIRPNAARGHATVDGAYQRHQARGAAQPSRKISCAFSTTRKNTAAG